jgi:hypothetical protein
MLSGAMAYQILQRERPATIETVTAILKQHPWYFDRWQRQPESEQMELLFMHAATW